MMSHPYCLIIVIMLVAGLLGGWLNYCLAFKERFDDGTQNQRLQSLLGGVVASFMVPLFLNMISSTLVDSIKGTLTSPGDPSKLFVFAGFCLIAAVSSKAFITSLSERILNEAKQARKEVKQIKKEVEPIIAGETEGEPQENENLLPSGSQQLSSGLSENANKVLVALTDGRFTLRTRTGISRDTQIQRSEVITILEDLVKKGLAKSATVLVRGEPKPRWYVTPQGRTIVDKP